MPDNDDGHTPDDDGQVRPEDVEVTCYGSITLPPAGGGNAQ